MNDSGYSRRFTETPGYSADWYCISASSQSSCLDPPLLPRLKPGMEVLREQESFLIPCLAQRKPQSLQNLGSIITQIHNNKHVTPSFSPPKSSWVTFAWGYLIYFLSFPSPPLLTPLPSAAADHRELCSCCSVMLNNNQFPDRHRAWAPGYCKLSCSGAKGDTSEWEE